MNDQKKKNYVLVFFFVNVNTMLYYIIDNGKWFSVFGMMILL
jgi:hypothetical protein